MTLKLTPVRFGNARFTVYSSGVVRLEYSERKKFSPYPSILCGGDMPAPAKAEVAVAGTKLTIRTRDFRLEFTDDGAHFSPDNLSIHHKNHWGETRRWFPGKKDAGNLGSVTRSLDFWTHCGGPAQHPVEGILTTDGAHFFPDEARVYWNTKHSWAQNLGGDVQFDGYFFAYGSDFKRALADFVSIFGKIPMVPRWAFGFWYSRYYAYKDSEFIELVKKYRAHGMPIDVMIIDTDWRKAVWGGYDWNPKFFPAPKKTMKALHDMNVMTSLNDHPGYDNYDGLPADDSRIPAIEKRLGPLPHQGEWACDWSRKDAVEAWKDVLLGPFFDEGMDFWWVDGWCKPPFAVYPMGGMTRGGIDSQFWLNRHYYELREERTGKRGLILSRWGGLGSHRYPVQFSGDTPCTWDMLKKQIPFTARSCGLGAAYWSHDIGGFLDPKIDEELFIRWFQFGSMSPIFRTHSNHGFREPWHFSAECTRIFRKQARMRAALAPLFYTLAHEAHATGLPLVRPLFIEYNNNNGGALNQDGEYLVGRDLLVVPADAPAHRATRCAEKRAYIPPGRWYELEGSGVFDGHCDMKLKIPLDVIPIFIREGAIIPCQPVGDCVGRETSFELHLDVYPSSTMNVLELYEDDGESRGYEDGKYSVTRIECVREGASIAVKIAAPLGSYPGMPKRRTWTLRIRIEKGERIESVHLMRSGRKPQSVRHRITNKALCGEVASGHAFAEIEGARSSGSGDMTVLVKLV